MKASPMNTMTEASTGAWENGRTMSRSMATPPRKEMTTVTTKACQ